MIILLKDIIFEQSDANFVFQTWKYSLLEIEIFYVNIWKS